MFCAHMVQIHANKRNLKMGIINGFFNQNKEKMTEVIRNSTTESVNHAPRIDDLATKFAENATGFVIQEGYKHVPSGGKAVVDIVAKRVHEGMKADEHGGLLMEVFNGYKLTEDTNKDEKQTNDSTEESFKDLPFSRLPEATREKLQGDMHQGEKPENNATDDNNDETRKNNGSAPSEADRKRVSIRSRL